MLGEAVRIVAAILRARKKNDGGHDDSDQQYSERGDKHNRAMRCDG